MSDTPRPPIPQPDLSQQQNPKAQPVTPDQVRQAQSASDSSGGGLQKIVAYFESQGASPDQVIATIAGIQLKLSDLKQSSGAREQAPPTPPPSPPQEDEFKP